VLLPVETFFYTLDSISANVALNVMSTPEPGVGLLAETQIAKHAQNSRMTNDQAGIVVANLL